MTLRAIRHWRVGLLAAPVLTPALTLVLILALALGAAPALAQPASLSSNPFTGSTYGSANPLGPPDPAKLWLQPGSVNTLFATNEYLNHEGMLGLINSGGT